MRAAPIDWDGLVAALGSSSEDDDRSYLHLPTGEVMSFSALDPDIAAGWIWSGLNDGWLLTIPPWAPSVEQAWLEEFVASLPEGSVRRKVKGSRAGTTTRQRSGNRVARKDRRRWIAFRNARLRESAQAWLREWGWSPRSGTGDPRPDRDGF